MAAAASQRAMLPVPPMPASRDRGSRATREDEILDATLELLGRGRATTG